ncbi:RNA polymerase sigma factor [Nakamurella endophytica]|uniref:RNA polymerase sigma factor n=1 Tax=Nakamurella endophytica TaxID=1748367 RepID=A0A917WCD5_9ACTN|nr:sigma-70 family RNA polymerase sigma factor [Nakamurella endophytica]GGL89485.1 RNA polymerase sigma factor [Nakamurella endophytica]
MTGAGEGRSGEAHRAVETVFRMELPRVIAGLARITGDVGLAEELAQEATVAALEQWPAEGVPANPGAWLTTAARRRAVDLFRRNAALRDKYRELARRRGADTELPDFDRAVDGRIEDDLLRLVFTACHPVLRPESRSALTLRLLCGLSTAEIARAYLVPEATVAARITRAKKALERAGVPFEVPEGPERATRLASVLEVLYLMFNEGYAATAGETWLRPDLTFEAVRLARITAGLLPDEPEVLGLLALLELQSSRTAARVDAGGAPVLLADQDRSRWDRLAIARGLAALDRAVRLGGASGVYALQAAIAACHARAPRAGDTDWTRVALLYQRLADVRPSPVVELNRAVAVSYAVGPEAALSLVDELARQPALRGYHLLDSVRGDLLSRLGRTDEAARAFRSAAALTRNARERDLLLGRAGDVPGGAGTSPPDR